MKLLRYPKIYLPRPYIVPMDRFTQFGLRGDADEQFRRAVRDGFKRAGLSHAQLTQAMDWYRDHVRPADRANTHSAGLESSLAVHPLDKRAHPDDDAEEQRSGNRA
jgi:hypothetical protein